MSEPAEPDERREQRPRHLGRGVLIGLAGLLLPVAGLVMVVRSCDRAAASGEVAVIGEPGWRVPLNRCKSGELHSFHGVDLGRDSDGKMLVRAIDDPDRGIVVELVPPAGGVTLRLTRDTCADLRLELRKQGVDEDGAALLDGRVVARCPLADGRRVQLDAWWRRCGPS